MLSLWLAMMLLMTWSLEVQYFARSDGQEPKGPEAGGTKLLFSGSWRSPRLWDFSILVGSENCKIVPSEDPQAQVACMTPARPLASLSVYEVSVFYLSELQPFAPGVSPSFRYYRGNSLPNLVSRESYPYRQVKISMQSEQILSASVASVPLDLNKSLGRNTHGDLNLDVTLLDGNVDPAWYSLQTDPYGNSYNFRVLSLIQSVSSNLSSSLGGLHLQIDGLGFPQKSSEVQVEVDGTECEVSSIDYNRIECTTGAKLQGNYKDAFEGGSGLKFEAWDSPLPFDQLVGVVLPYKETVVPTPELTDLYSRSRLIGLFKPPSTGSYVFYFGDEEVLFEGRTIKSGEEISMSEGKSYDFEVRLYHSLPNLSVKAPLVPKIPSSLSTSNVSSSPHTSDMGFGNDMPLVQTLSRPRQPFKVSFRGQQSLVLDPSTPVEEIQSLLNSQIEAFQGQLYVLERKELEFMLPASFFLKGVDYLEVSVGEDSFKSMNIRNEPGDGKLWFTIPSDFLRTKHQKSQVRVHINNSLASCEGNCDLAYVDPPVVHSFFQKSSLLTLEGYFLPRNDHEITVTVAESECPLIRVNDFQYQCKLLEREAGESIPVVHNRLLGFYKVHAPSSRKLLFYPLQIASVSPSQGGSSGGTVLTIAGDGFPVSLEKAKTNAKVEIGQSPCEITSSNFTHITCITTPQTTDSVLTLTVNRYRAQTSDFFYIDTLNMSITAVSPEFASTLEPTEIIINGSNFGDDPTILSVYIGPYECYIVELSDTRIHCNLNGGLRGTYDVVLSRSQYGSASFPNFSIVYELSQVSPSSGSTLGGTVLTLTGRGFSTRDQAHQVLIGRVGECEVIEVVDTNTITCRTQPTPQGSGINGTLQNDVDYPVEVLGKLIEFTQCTGVCTFRWSSSLTPSITAISPSSGVAGDTVTLTGSNLTDDTDTISLTFDGVQAEILSSSTSSIEAIVPNVMSRTPEIILQISGAGLAQTDVQFTNNQNIASIEPNQISLEGAIVQVNGSGLADDPLVLEGGLLCALTESTDDFVKCRLGLGTCTTGCAVEYSLSSTPQITALQSDLEIQGNFLGTADFVNLIDSTSLEVFACNIESASTTSIVCFPDAPAGTYSVEVHIQGFGFAAGEFLYFVELNLSSLSPVNSSYAGGREINLQGTGLHSSNQITICGLEAEVLSPTLIRTPPLLTLFSQQEYQIEFDYPSVTQQLFPIGPNLPELSLAFDGDSSTFYSSFSDNWIGVDSGPEYLIQLKTFSVTAGGTGVNQYKELKGNVIQGSNDLSSWETLFTFDDVKDNENSFNPDPKPIYRAFRVFNPETSATWFIKEIEVLGAVLVNSSSEEFLCDLAITTLNGQTVTETSAVIYSPDSTPVLNMIAPEMGSALGGETVVFDGQNFSGASASVTIDGVGCLVLSVTDTQVTCATLPLFFFSEETLQIYIEGKGYVATQGQIYMYAERWSDPRTWGGLAPPRYGESVYVSRGTTLILDTPIPYLETITVEGRLIVEDKPGLGIETQLLVISLAELIIGTKEKPFTNDFTITLVGGIDDIVFEAVGGKNIFSLSSTIDVHGVPRQPTWTFLAESAWRNSNFIVVSEDVDWEAGEEIAIAPTGYEYYEGEKRTIAYKQGRKLFLDKPLRYDHYSLIAKYGDSTVDMRAEVGLLTRNIKIVGALDEEDERYGGQIFMSFAFAPSIIRFSYTEFYRMGQWGRILRYPLHFHLLGILEDAYAIGNSFHECFNRAIVVHGTSYVNVEDNVSYDIYGHAYFLEDGNEFQNSFRNNLAIYTRQSFGLLLTDFTPSGFWITNPNNFYYGNHAVGSAYYGFWIDLPVNPPFFIFGDAPEVLCTQFTEYGAFQNNVAHSNGFTGLLIEPKSVPVINPCEPAVNRDIEEWWTSNPAIPGLIENFKAFKNKDSGVAAFEIGDIRFLDIQLVENLQNGIRIGWTNFSEPFNSVRIDGALIVGPNLNRHLQEKAFVGIVTPQTDGMLIRNVHFYNINWEMRTLGDSLFANQKQFADYGARLHKLSGFKYFNSNRKIDWNEPFRGFFEDEDGSISGVPGAFLAAYWPHLFTEGCYFREELNSLVCSENKIRRVHFYNLSPNLLYKDLFVEYKGQVSRFPMITTDEKKDIKYSWAVPFVTGREYNVYWQDDWDTLNLEIDTFEGDEFVILNFNVTSRRTSYTASRGVATDSTTILSQTDSLSTTDTAGTYEVGEDFFKVILSGVPANSNQFNDIEIQASSCCTQLNYVSASSGTFRWSDPSSWPNRELPPPGSSVFVDKGVTLILDIKTPVLKYVEVNGRLEFDPLQNVELNSDLIYIRTGTIASGSLSEPLDDSRTHKIILHGQNDFHLPGIDVGNRVLVNSGSLEMYGSRRKAWTLLVQNAQPGDLYIFVNEVTDWQIGDEIGITSSSFDKNEIDIATIAYIEQSSKNDKDWAYKNTYKNWGRHRNKDTNLVSDTIDESPNPFTKIYLKSPLKNYHSGSTLAFGEKSIDMKAEVIHLRRNIEIRGSVLTTEQTAPSSTILHSVSMLWTDQFALRFEENPDGSADVQGILVRNALNGAVNISNANSIQFSNNALVNVKWRGINIESTSDTAISGNAIVNVVNRDLTDTLADLNAAIIGCESSCENTMISNNRAVSLAFAGIIGPAGLCGENTIFSRNLVRDAEIGWMIKNNGENSCLEINDFTATFSKLGIGSIVTYIEPETANLNTVKTIKLKNIHLAENEIGFALRSGMSPVVEIIRSEERETPVSFYQHVTDSLIVGKTLHSFYNNEDCRTGFLTGFSDENPSTEIKLPLYRSQGNSHALGNSTIEGVTFANFYYKCQFAFQSNPLVPDYSLPHFFKQTALMSVPESGIVYMNNPSEFCTDILCTGLKNVLIQDTDGSLLGGEGAILSNNPGIASKEICKFNAYNNAFFCLYRGKDYYEMLIYDELKEEDRMITPLVIQSYNETFESYLGKPFYNELTGTFDHSGDQLSKRRFPSIVYTGLVYNITFTGVIGVDSRIYLGGTNNRDEAISVNIDFELTNEHGVLINDVIVPYIGYSEGDDRNPNLFDEHATNKWYLDVKFLEIILRNEIDVLQLDGGEQVQAALNVEMSSFEPIANGEGLPYIDVIGLTVYTLPYLFKSVAANVDAFRLTFAPPEGDQPDF